MPEKKNVASSQETLLKVEHLCQYFKENKAVDDVSFEVKKGEVFGLVGESGCGKTTTGRSIIKLYNITSGNVYFKGERIAAGTGSYKWEIEKAKKAYTALKKSGVSGEKLKDAKKKRDEVIAEQKKQIRLAQEDQKRRRAVTDIQMIFQDPIASIDPRMTVRQIIAEGLVIRGEKDQKKIDEEVYRVLELVGLVREHAGRYPHEFSGGQRQRIGLARAMVMEPELVVADEPISALDVSIRAQVLNLLKKFQREKQVTYLFIAHDLSIVRFISDRIGVIYKGNIVEVADAEELFNFPLHPYTHSLISAIPIPDPQLEKNKVLYTYDPSIHDYSVDKPEFVDIGHNHFVYGNKKEIEEYKALREKGEPLQPITIRKPDEEVKEEDHEVHFSKAEDEFLKTPLHDTGSIWYKVLSFFLPIIGIIAACVYKKKQYYHNYKACKQGALYGFAVLAVILLIFILALILVAL